MLLLGAAVAVASAFAFAVAVAATDSFRKFPRLPEPYTTALLLLTTTHDCNATGIVYYMAHTNELLRLLRSSRGSQRLLYIDWKCLFMPSS